MSVAGNTSLSAIGTGAYSSTAGIQSGDGTGGTILVQSTTGGDMVLGDSVFDTFDADASGYGGHTQVLGADAGGGFGGTVNVFTSGGSSMDVAGPATLAADGVGGFYFNDCGECGPFTPTGGLGGIGDGGNINVQAHTGPSNTMDFASRLTMAANGLGSNGFTGDGGDGLGGDIILAATGGSAIAVAEYVSISAYGSGGNALGATGDGADGLGGDATVLADTNGSLGITGSIYEYLDGSGGSSEANNGGYGQGGFGQLFANGGSVAVGDYSSIQADGRGGDGLASGGEGQGGSAYFSSSNGGSLAIGAYSWLTVDGFGGDAYDADGFGGNGGLGEGGHAEAYANNATLDAQGSLFLSADGQGGSAGGLSDAGDGQGGDIYVQALNAGSLSIAGGLYASAVGTGDYISSTTNSGDGIGGFIGIYARDGDSTLTVSDSADLDADGRANVEGECSQCSTGGVGGIGQGGTITMSSQGATGDSGNLLDFGGGLFATANGYGGDGVGGGAGDGFGGTVTLSAASGNSVNVIGNVTLLAKGYGGYDFGGFAAGDGFGGFAQITSVGTGASSLSVEGLAQVGASGYGGDSGSQIGGEGPGGDGTGGTASIGASSGTLTVGDASIKAEGWGGSSASNTGGTGTGGDTILVANGGDVSVLGNASLSSNGWGGDGLIGGDGFGGGDISDPQNNNGGAEIVAINGDIAIGSYANVGADGYGGDGTDFGGDSFFEFGANGGIGGNGFGGYAVIASANSDLGPSSITITGVETAALVSADGFGGNGGGGALGANGLNGIDGASGNQGENGSAGGPGGAGGLGGAGGTGTGGVAGIFANAGNGQLTIDFASASAVGEGGWGGSGGSGGAGGAGGNGGSGDALPGGDGGNGGNGGNAGSGGAGGGGIGGRATIGTASGSPQAAGSNLGLATIGFAELNASATGGRGGDGGFSGSAGGGGLAGFGSPNGSDGASGTAGLGGNGGTGGDAQDGTALLLVRGSTLDVGFAQLTADATGGDAGFGSDGGATAVGGNATVGGDGGILVLVTNRFLIPDQRGTLIAGTINGTAVATSGIGIPNGNRTSLGGSGVVFLNSDGNIGSLDFLVQLGQNELTAGVDSISVLNGDVVVDGDFTFVTPGNLSLFANNGSMTAGGTLTLTAGNFVPDANNEPPTNAGTYFANAINITSGLNIYTSANLDSILGLNLNAAGFIVTGNLNGNSGDVIVEAQGGLVDVGNVDGGFVHIEASDSVTAGDINSDSNIQVTSGTDMNLGNLVAGVTIDQNSNKAVRLDAGGSINVGDVTALGGIDFSADGSVTGLDITSGEVVFASADGAISFGNISSGLIDPQPPTGDPFSVGLNSATSISVGDVAGAGGLAFLTLGALTTGNLSSGGDVLGLAGGNMSFGAITAGSSGRTYLADVPEGLLVGNVDNDGDPEVIFAAAPIASAGTITILGPVSTGSLQAAGTSINAGDINANSFIQMISTGNMTLGDLVAGVSPSTEDAVGLESGGSIVVGNINSAGGIDFSAAGSVTGLNITTGDELGGNADGALSFANISAGLVNPQGPVADGFSVELSSGTSITVGSVAGAEGVSLASLGALTTANITAGTEVLATASGNMNLGNLLAGTSIALGAGGNMAFGNATAQSGSVEASATGSMSFLDISAGTFVTIDPTDIVGGDVIALAGDVNLTGGSIDIGNVSASDNVLLTAVTGDLSTGTIGAGIDVTLNAAGDVTTGNITAGGLIDATGASLTLGNLIAYSIDLTTTVADLTVGNVTIPGDLALTTAGDLIFGDLSAFDVDLAATGSITGGSIDSDTNIAADAGTSMTLLDLEAGGFDDSEGFWDGSVYLTAGGNIDTGDILAEGGLAGGSITAIADGDIDTGDLVTRQLAVFGFGEVTLLSFVPGVSIWLDSGGDIATGNITSFDSVHAQALGGIGTGAIDAQGFVGLFAGGDVDTDDVDAGNQIDILAGGDVTLGDLVAGLSIDPSDDKAIQIDAEGSIAMGGALAAGRIDFSSGGTVTGGNLTSGVQVGGDANGAINLGAISAGLVNPQGPAEDGFSVGIASATSVTVGNVAGAESVGFASLGSVSTGNITAGGNFLVMASGNMNFGAITTALAGRTYLADSSMFIAAGGVDNFNASLVLNAAPVVTGGSITIGGPVSTGRFQAAAGTGLSAGAINAQTIEASAGGTATIGGLWSAPSVLLRSNDIDITAAGGIEAGNTGQVTLQSSNATQALIGDGLTGTGYALTNAEFGRISSGSLFILANGNASATPDMLIGDLSITGPTAGSTIDNPNGTVLFATGNLNTQVSGGVIRVVGDIAATGFQSGNTLEFQTGLFELDAATGSIFVTGVNNALAGNLDITADRIHVASGTILDQLALNPQYAGYQGDLNDPAAVQRPDGVIGASNIFVQPTEAVLVQNTGTADIPAGFIANLAELTAPEGAPAGSIELIVNGQLVTEAGTLTGKAARDAYVADTDLSIYSDNSMINGCLLVGPCGVVVEPEPPIDPVGGISTEITLLSGDLLSEQPFGNEPVIDDQEGAEDDESSSPIEPPAPLFDTRPLNPDADVDEPISGSGNPALMGAGPVNDGDQQ
ncbi:MAG TPA: hypothetical protein VK485_11355 [Sphingomicrobium sp.]|nr:hypothetical protein [Sphingomicrobium sp.]